jgi:hypothetical protein
MTHPAVDLAKMIDGPADGSPFTTDPRAQVGSGGIVVNFIAAEFRAIDPISCPKAKADTQSTNATARVKLNKILRIFIVFTSGFLIELYATRYTSICLASKYALLRKALLLRFAALCASSANRWCNPGLGNLRQIEKVASYRQSWYFNLSGNLLR